MLGRLCFVTIICFASSTVVGFGLFKPPMKPKEASQYCKYHRESHNGFFDYPFCMSMTNQEMTGKMRRAFKECMKVAPVGAEDWAYCFQGRI